MEDKLKDLNEIRSIMERSTKFISLSGLSGVSAGLVGIVGASLAHWKQYHSSQFYAFDLDNPMFQFFVIDAAFVFVFALTFAFYFTQRRAKNKGLKLWNSTSKRMLINMLIPLLVGGVFCLMLLFNTPKLIPASTLIFYGLALINGSKYTLDDIRYLGFCEIIVGFICGFYAYLGLDFLFLGIGFGLLHIIYGVLMYKKYGA